MSDSSATYELNARVTAWDAATSVFSKIGNHWDALINKFEMAPDDSAWVSSLQKRAKYAVTFSAISAAAFVGLTTSMVHSRLAVEELTGDIRTLGATSAEIQRIESATTAMSAKLGIAQTTLLTGIYDIKSAVSTLDLSALPEFTDAIARTAVATKGNFEDLSKTFGMVYNQFAHRYQHLSEVDFARNLGNNITWAANKFRADGESINQAFTTLGSSAATAGFTLEEQSAIIGRLLNTMVPSTAGNSFRVFVDKMDTGLAKLGISKIDPVTKKMKALPDILDEIAKKSPSNKLLNEAFSEEGTKMLRELLPHTKALREDMIEIATASMNQNWQFLDDASAIKMQTFPVSLRRIREGLTAIWGQISSGVGPLTTLVSWLADGVEWLARFTAEHPKVAQYIGTFALLATAIGAVGGMIVAASSVLKMWTILNFYSALASGAATSASGAYALGLKAVGVSMLAATKAAWGFAVALMANPLTWIVLGVVALIAGIALLIIHWDKVKAAGGAALTWIRERWSSAPGWLRGLLAVLFVVLTGGLGIIVILAAKHWDKIVAYGTAAWRWIANVWDAGITAFVALWERLSSGATIAFETVTGLWNRLPGWAQGLIVLLSPLIGLPLLIASNWAQFKGIVTDLLAGNFDAAWVRIKSLAQKAGLGFVTAFLEGMFKGAGQLLGGVKFLFEQVDKFLPHSDAKMGPLSRLTQAGRALTGTLALGMVAATPTLVRATDDMARSIAVPEIVREVVSPGRRSEPVNIQGGNQATVNVNLQHGNRGRSETIEDWGRQMAEAIYDELERV